MPLPPSHEQAIPACNELSERDLKIARGLAFGHGPKQLADESGLHRVTVYRMVLSPNPTRPDIVQAGEVIRHRVWLKIRNDVARTTREVLKCVRQKAAEGDLAAVDAYSSELRTWLALAHGEAMTLPQSGGTQVSVTQSQAAISAEVVNRLSQLDQSDALSRRPPPLEDHDHDGNGHPAAPQP